MTPNEGEDEVNERNDNRLERIVGLLRKRVEACDQLIDEPDVPENALMRGYSLYRREEAKAILATVLEIVKGAKEEK